MTELSVEQTPIPGLLVVRLPLHEDSRGWFKENWQRAKMTALGLPDFGPVQHSVAYNARRGVTRGVHTEPWDKFISVAHGRIFGAWVDMREGDSFGEVFTIEADPSVAVFVPRGVGNSYQVLEDDTTYSYLVNDHWRPGLAYPALNLADPTVAIPWPIPLAEAEISDKDLTTPMLADVVPMAPRKTLIVGAKGQLGTALQADFPGADLVDLAPGESPTVSSLDVTDPKQVAAWPWNEYGLVLNAAAYTAVDAAETPEGRRTAWAANAGAPATLARLAAEHRFTLVHYSTEYVFDGTVDPHTEDEPLSPARRLRADQGGRRRRGRHRAQALRAAHLVGDRRGQELRAHHAAARRQRRQPLGRRRPGRPAHLHRRAVPGHAAPARRRRGRTAPTT